MELFGALATTFKGTAIVECDFSLLRWEVDEHCLSILRLSTTLPAT